MELSSAIWIFADKDAVDVGTDHTYYAFEDSQAKRIPVHEIWDYIRLAHNNNCEKLHQEFQVLNLNI